MSGNIQLSIEPCFCNLTMLQGRSTSHAYLVNVYLVCCSNYCLKCHPLVKGKCQAKLQWKMLKQSYLGTSLSGCWVHTIRNHNTQQIDKEDCNPLFSFSSPSNFPLDFPFAVFITKDKKIQLLFTLESENYTATVSYAFSISWSCSLKYFSIRF